MGQHRHHTTRSTPQIPTRPPAHSPLSTGELRGYNTPCGMLVEKVYVYGLLLQIPNEDIEKRMAELLQKVDPAYLV